MYIYGTIGVILLILTILAVVLVEMASNNEEEVEPEIIDIEHKPGGHYRFVASEPKNGFYWVWKFPNEEYWFGYEEDNVITYHFSDEEGEEIGDEVTIKLRILDKEGNMIGKTVSKSLVIE